MEIPKLDKLIPKSNNQSEDRVFKRAICQKRKKKQPVFKSYEDGPCEIFKGISGKEPNKTTSEARRISSDWEEVNEVKKNQDKKGPRGVVVYDDMDLFT